MCGFLGYIVKKTDVSEELKKKFKVYHQKMSHRGPDFQTEISNENNSLISSFGFSRLSIQDLNENANKIFRNHNSILLFNGEIYNKYSLTKKYLDTHKLETSSDTEVLFLLLINFGVKIISEIEGIFSIVYYDLKNSKVYLIRDYTGTKPLYYFSKKNNIFFSSEAWFLYSLSKKEFDYDCLNFYFRFGFTLNAKTLIKDVLKIKPNTILEYNLKTNNFIEKKIIDFSENNLDNKKQHFLLRQDLTKSIEKNLIGDRKIGVFLSGGIDSTIISLTAKKLNDNIEAFTSIYEDSEIKQNDDLIYTQKICKEFNIKLNLAIIKKDQVIKGDTLYKISSYFDEPIANLNMISSYEQSKIAYENNSSVVITGDGADEIFGGYKKYKTLKISNYLKYFSIFNKKLKNYSYNNEEIPYLFFLKNSDADYEFIFDKNFNKSILSKKNHLIKNVNENNLTKLNNFDFYNWLPDEHNLKLDRCTMANSIEGRVPFQDLTILKYFSPKEIDKKVGLFRNKPELRKAFSDLPDYILKRKKRGWFLNDKKILKDFLKKNSYDLIKSDNNKGHNIFNEENLLKIFNKSDDIKFNKYTLISIIMFKLWYQKIVNC